MNQNYPERMNRTGRPVSPHPTIYAFHITALSSITNRVTGCALTFGAAGVASLELIGGNGAALGPMRDLAEAGPAVATVAKFSVAFPCVYHYLGAVRHLVCDRFSDMLTNVDVVKASYALVGGSVLASVGIALVWMNGGNGSILFQSHAWRRVHTPARRPRTPVRNAHPRIEQIPSAATETKTKPKTTISMHPKPGTKSRRRLEARLSKERKFEILRLAKGGMAKMLDEFVVLCKFIESITFYHFQHRAQGKKH
jgi:succinate dehydrogenase (ubiquinone) cytochrome b560 subunit